MAASHVNQLVSVDMHVNSSQNNSMPMVKLTPEAADGLEELSNPIHGRVLKLLVKLEQWPHVSALRRSLVQHRVRSLSCKVMPKLLQ